MKSRITIEVDFDNDNEPVIQILHDADTEDVRDALIRNFLHKFEGISKWLKLEYSNRIREGQARILIRPITRSELQDEANEMLEAYKDGLKLEQKIKEQLKEQRS